MTFRISNINEGIGPTIPNAIIRKVVEKRGASACCHLNLHSNRIQSLGTSIKVDRNGCGWGNVGVFDCLVDINLSGNCLHQGCAVVDGRGGASLLHLCRNLQKLDLSFNKLTDGSFSRLVGTSQLSNLHTLNVSNNCLSKMDGVASACSSLRCLDASNNGLKSLSSNLQALAKLKLEVVDMRGNPLCSKDLYGEKLLYLLRRTLTHMDGRCVESTDVIEAKSAIETALSASAADHRDDSDGIQLCEKENAAPKSRMRISLLEREIAELSASLNETSTTSAEPKASAAPAKPRKTKPRLVCREVGVNTSDEIFMHQKGTAVSLLRLILDRKGLEHAMVLLSFGLWRASANAAKSARMAQTNINLAETGFQAKLDTLKREARAQIERYQRELAVSQREILRLNKSKDKLAIELSKANVAIEVDKKTMNADQEEIIRLKSELASTREQSQKDCDKCAEDNKASAATIALLHDRLKALEEDLDQSKRVREDLLRENDKLVSEKRELNAELTKSKERDEGAKLELQQRDSTIQRLRHAYSQAASKVSADRARMDQKMDSLHADLRAKELSSHRTVEGLEVKVATLQNECEKRSARLKSAEEDIARRDAKIDTLERRFNFVSEDRDELQERQRECRKRRAQAEEDVGNLRAQLDRLREELVSRDRVTACEKERLGTVLAKNQSLEKELASLAESGKRNELDLRSLSQRLERENRTLAEEAKGQSDLVSSLDERLREARRALDVRDEESRKDREAEMEKLRKQTEGELTILNERLDNESECWYYYGVLLCNHAPTVHVCCEILHQSIEGLGRLEVERKLSRSEEEREKQRLKIQRMLQGLAKELT